MSKAAPDSIGKAVIFLVLTMLLWSTTIIITRTLIMEIPPASLALIRWSIGTPFLFLLVKGASTPLLPKGDRKWILALAFSGVFGFTTLSNSALLFMSASRFALLSGFMPAMTAIMSILVLKEVATKPQALGIGISILGIIVITGSSLTKDLLSSGSLLGDALALIAMIGYAFYTSGGRRIMSTGRFTPTQLTYYTALFSLPISIVPSTIELTSRSVSINSPITILLLLYLAAVSVIGFTWWNKAVKIAGANTAAPFTNLIPVFALVLAFIFLGDKVSLNELVGGSIVILGALLTTIRRSKKNIRVILAPDLVERNDSSDLRKTQEQKLG